MNNLAKDRKPEFDFTDEDFEAIRKLVFKKTGISLSDQKRNMVYSRIVRRLRALNLSNFKSYCDLVSTEAGKEEIVDFINAVTTNLTKFFREAYHFEHLEKHSLPEVIKANRGNRRLRIWSAGCSSGMEPYSIAMVLNLFKNQLIGWDVKILATDIDTNMLAHGKAGIYRKSDAENIPKRFASAYKINGDEAIMSQTLRDMIYFKPLNFIEKWPVRGPFDIIFCRNVVIYFNKDTQRVIFNSFADVIGDGKYLYIGHSENLQNVCKRFEHLGKTIYKKIN